MSSLLSLRPLVFPAIALCLFFSGCTKVDPDGDVTGSVFIVTAGAGSYKFGLVKVYFCPEDELIKELKPIGDEFAKQDKDKYLAALQAESNSAKASSALETALTKQAVAGSEMKKYVDAAKNLNDFEASMDQTKTAIAKMIQKSRPDIAKSWEDATRLSSEVMDELFVRSQKVRVPLPNFVRIFGCVLEESDGLGKSLRDQLNLTEKLAASIQYVQPMGESSQYIDDILTLFQGHPDTVIGQALVGPGSGADSGSNKTVQAAYQAAVSSYDHTAIFNAIYAGAENQVDAYETAHPDVHENYNASTLSEVRADLKAKGDAVAQVTTSYDDDAKKALDVEKQTAKKFADLKTDLMNFPKAEAARCLAFNTLAKFTAETDADGVFKIRLPKSGRFIIIASSQRTVGLQNEYNFWIVPFALNNQPTGMITLSNDNELFAKDGSGAQVIDLRPKNPEHQWK